MPFVSPLDMESPSYFLRITKAARASSVLLCLVLSPSLILGLALGGLSGCSAARMADVMDSNASALNSGAADAGLQAIITDAASLAKACSDNAARLKTQTHPLSFPKPATGCAWNQDGNLGLRNSYFQARTEQVAQMQLPSNSVICDLRFRFANQPYYYDDQFLMTFNGAVMASSYNFGTLLDSTGMIQTYDWTRLVGRSWGSAPEQTYCAGQAQGLATCSFPMTSTTGTISLDYAPELIHGVVVRSLNQPIHEIRWITTGDNDDAIDCRHEPVDLEVDVTYLEL